MNPDELLSQILARAVELPAEQREAFLREACAGNDELLHQALSLLPYYAAEPAMEIEAASALEAWDEEVRRKLPELVAGQRIDDYELKRRCGSGGMGEVWEAERVHPFHQRVAIKIVQRTNPVHVQAFHAERETLGKLEHPYIASIFGGGELKDGRPYLVMEFVDGKPITSYCRNHRLSPTQCLDLFRRICDAIHYAHGKCIIHRDIKPQNILVTEDGTPKLVDFGIATEETRTTAGDPLTIAYASPEQFQEGALLTPKTDVYSLGVVLYELVAQRTLAYIPLGERRDAIEVLCETQTSRATDAPGVHLDRETAAVVLKAISKKPSDRYDSVAHLSQDIARQVQNLPVHAFLEACRHQSLHRTHKFVRRHSVLLLVLITTVMALSSVAWLGYQQTDYAQVRAAIYEAQLRIAQIRDPGDRSRAQSTLAETFAKAGNVQQSVILFDEAKKTVAQISDPYLRSVAQCALAETFAKAGNVQQSVILFDEAKKTVAQIGNVYNRFFAQSELAEALAKTGQMRQAKIVSEQAQHTAVQFGTFFSRPSVELVERLAKMGQFAEAQQAASHIGNPDDRLRAQSALAEISAEMGNFDQARKAALQISDSRDRCLVLRATAETLDKMGNMQQAEILFEEAEKVARQSSDPYFRSLAQTAFARALAKMGKMQQAGIVLEEARKTIAQITEFSDVRSGLHSAVAQILAEMGRFEEAQKAATQISDPRHRFLAQTAFARALAKMGKMQQARVVLEEAQDAATQISDPASRLHAQNELAVTLAKARKFKQAREIAPQLDVFSALTVYGAIITNYANSENY